MNADSQNPRLLPVSHGSDVGQGMEVDGGRFVSTATMAVLTEPKALFQQSSEVTSTFKETNNSNRRDDSRRPQPL